MLQSVTAQEKTLSTFDKHVVEMIRGIESQMVLAKQIATDYKMVYTKESATSGASDDDLPLVAHLMPLIERYEREVVRPFVEKCNVRIQQPIRQYIHELHEAKGPLIKQRQNKLLDFEMYRDKYNNACSSTKSTPQQIEEARVAFDNARSIFDEVDQQAKQMLRDVVIKRYTVFHPLVADLYGDILADYYEAMASLGQLLKKIRSIPAPETVMPEPYNWKSDVDLNEEMYPQYSEVTTTTTIVSKSTSPPNAARVTPPIPFGQRIPEHLNRDWYYLDANNDQKGPVRVPELKQKYKSKQINENTYIVTEGMSSWELLGNHELFNYVQ